MSLPQIAIGVATSLATPFLTPAITALNYEANKLFPVIIPAPESIINVALQSYPEIQNETVAFLRWHGIECSSWSDQLRHYATSVPGDAVAMLSNEFVTADVNWWQLVVRTQLYRPSIEECNFLLNRTLITPSLYNYLVDSQVDCNQSIREMWKAARYEIPGPQDLVRFAVREAYNPTLIEQYGYHHEVPLEVLPWMAKQGYGGRTGLQIPPNGTDGDGNPRLGDAKWLDLYWWSHWELPSPTQGYDMVHRLYGESPYGQSPYATDTTIFNPSDLSTLLKASDYPDYWRERLIAISYVPIDKHDGQEMFANGLISERDMFHVLRTHGHNNDDSTKLLRLANLRRQRDLGIDPGKQNLNYVCEYYKLGIISDTEAKDMLSKLAFNEQDTNAFIAKCKLEIKGEAVKEFIKVMEQSYYRGLYSYDELERTLDMKDINPEISKFWLASWKVKREVTFKSASAKQNLTAYKNGILNEPALVSRLFNLGYDGSSVTLMVNNTKATMIQTQTQALMRQQKQAASAAKAAQDLATKAKKKQLKKVQDDAKIVTNKAEKRMRAFVKVSTDANVKAWFTDKLIQLWEVYYRLFYKGYSISDADKWVQANFKDQTKEQRYVASTKAQKQFISEGNYIE